ncbi:MAG: hypothetical protein EA375_04345 [Acholeplasmataceae bacterium]|nr:MAG: hypothetical protein EA375_04345 [Acholeplasmataceae bacterium]
MKKLLILACLVFLFSCNPSSAVPIKRSYFVTGAAPVPLSHSYTNKLVNFDQYEAALDTEFKMPATYRIFDEAFFDDNDLIVVILEVSGSLNQQMFSLEGVYEKGGTIYVKIRVTYPQGESPTIMSRYTYLIVIDKMEDMPVSLDVTHIR